MAQQGIPTVRGIAHPEFLGVVVVESLGFQEGLCRRRLGEQQLGGKEILGNLVSFQETLAGSWFYPRLGVFPALYIVQGDAGPRRQELDSFGETEPFDAPHEVNQVPAFAATEAVPPAGA